MIRGFLGKVRFAKYKYIFEEGLRKNATTIQKYIRRKLAIFMVNRLRESLLVEAEPNDVYGDDDEEKEGVKSWLKWYGKDAEYG